MKSHKWMYIFLLFLLAEMGAKDVVLKHDDGKQDDRQSLGGQGHALRFERPSADFVITEVQVYGSLYGAGYNPFLEVAKIYLCDEGLMPLGLSADVALEAFKKGRPEWIKVPVIPITPPEVFYVFVDFLATGTKGVYLGVDGDRSGHSLTGKLGKPGGTYSKGDWMIRVRGKNDPDLLLDLDFDSETELKYDDGEQDRVQSRAGEGHAVEFTPPKGEWYVTGVSLHGSMYGGNFDPGRTYFNVFICDRRLKVLSRSAHPYNLFPFGKTPRWVDVEVPPTKVKGKFIVLVSYNPTQTKGIFMSIDKVKKSHSLIAMPERPGGKLSSKEDWMIRATVMKEREEEKATASRSRSKPKEEEAGVDAMQIVEWGETLDALEIAEDLATREVLLSTIAKISEKDAEAFGKVHVTDHVWVKYQNIPDKYAEAVATLYETCDGLLKEKYGVKNGVSAHPGKRLHVHLLAEKDNKLSLFTAPGSTDHSLVVNTMPNYQRGFSPPTEGGPHIVYGLCHELGHVLMGWEDSRHQWAHYLGSLLLDQVVDHLGEATWPKPYDYRAEGMARFKTQIQGAQPDRETDEGTARIFYEVGETFGLDVWGKVLAWIQEHREGKPFGVVRQYCLNDIRDGLLALEYDAGEVKRLFKE